MCYPVSLPPPLLPPPSCAHGPDVYRTRRELTTVVSLNNEQLFHDPESRLTATVRENIPTEKPFSFSLSLSLSLSHTHGFTYSDTSTTHTVLASFAGAKLLFVVLRQRDIVGIDRGALRNELSRGLKRIMNERKESRGAVATFSTRVIERATRD